MNTFYRVFATMLAISCSHSVLANELKVRQALLGYSYDLDKAQPISPVLDVSTGHIAYSGEARSSYRLVQDMSAESYLAELGVKTHAGFSIGVFNIEGGIDFASNLSSDDLTMSMTHVFEATGRQAYLDGASYTKEAAKVIANQNPEHKKAKFGHGFIHGVSLTAKLLVTMSFKFSSRQSKNEFKGRFAMDIPAFFKASAEGGAKYQKLVRNTQIRIDATQVGGNPSKLTSLLKSNGQGSSFVECGSGKLEPCEKLLQQLTDYGAEFGNSINMIYDPSNPYGPAIALSDVISYKNYGLTEVEETLTEVELAEIEAQREGLTKTYLELRSDRAKLTKLFKVEPPEDESERLRKISEVIENLIQKTYETVHICYNKPGQCLTAVASYKANKPTYKREEIDFEWSFYNYCEYEKEDAAIEKTMLRVRKAFEAGKDMTCRDLDVELKDTQFLDLSFKPEQQIEQISDLRPLRGLRNLRWLDLSGQAVGKIEKMGKCEKLTKLIAPYNHLRQIINFSFFPALEYLDLAFNSEMVIGDCLDQKESLSKLKFVNVRNARFADGDGESFRKTMESNSDLKRFVSLFASNFDICQKHRLSAKNMKIIDDEDFQHLEKIGKYPDPNARSLIFVPCNSKVEL